MSPCGPQASAQQPRSRPRDPIPATVLVPLPVRTPWRPGPGEVRGQKEVYKPPAPAPHRTCATAHVRSSTYPLRGCLATGRRPRLPAVLTPAPGSTEKSWKEGAKLRTRGPRTPGRQHGGLISILPAKRTSQGLPPRRVKNGNVPHQPPLIWDLEIRKGGLCSLSLLPRTFWWGPGVCWPPPDRPARLWISCFAPGLGGGVETIGPGVG